MRKVVEFSQMSFPEGVCFREAFKWLACQIYGRPFVFDVSYFKEPLWAEMRTALKGLLQNDEKVYRKQQAYLGAVRPYEGKGKAYGTFLMQANAISLDTIRAWGNKAAKDGSAKYALQVKHRVYGSLSRWTRPNGAASALLGIYGTSTGGPWAHATALFMNGAGARFFDANSGEWGFDPGEEPVQTIDGYLREQYDGPAGKDIYAIKDFVVYEVSRA